MQITRTQIKQLPKGFTPTGETINRRQRRSKEYQKMITGLYKQEALKITEQNNLTDESTINTTTE